MLKIDTGKMEFLLSLFVDLEEEYQNKAIAYILGLILEQKAKAEIATYSPTDVLKNDFDKNQAVEKRTGDIKHETAGILNAVSAMDDEQRAMMVILMEKLHPGTYTKKERISVTVNSKSISLKDYWEHNFSNIDYEKTKEKVEKFLS